MTSAGSTLATVRVSRRFDAAPEQVFDAWLDPARAGRWLFAAPAGEMVRVEIDARVGGRFLFADRRDGEDVEHVGEYLEIDRPRRLVFTFAVPKYSPVVTRVTVEIAPSADGGCVLTLTHEGVLPDYASRTEGGWTMILDGLAASLASEGGAIPDAIVVERTLPYPPERVWRALTRSDLIAQWLMPNDFEPAPGRRFTFRTRPMGDWDGVVSCEGLEIDPPRRLRYSWVGGSTGNPGRLDSTVTWTLTPMDGGNATHVLMEHEGFRPGNESAHAATSGGWVKVLAGLERVTGEAG